MNVDKSHFPSAPNSSHNTSVSRCNWVLSGWYRRLFLPPSRSLLASLNDGLRQVGEQNHGAEDLPQQLGGIQTQPAELLQHERAKALPPPALMKKAD
jgi:hypothetical protein